MTPRKLLPVTPFVRSARSLYTGLLATAPDKKLFVECVLIGRPTTSDIEIKIATSQRIGALVIAKKPKAECWIRRGTNCNDIGVPDAVETNTRWRGGNPVAISLLFLPTRMLTR